MYMQRRRGVVNRGEESRRGFKTAGGIWGMILIPVLFFPVPIRCRTLRGFNNWVYEMFFAFPDGQLLVYESRAPRA